MKYRLWIKSYNKERSMKFTVKTIQELETYWLKAEFSGRTYWELYNKANALIAQGKF